MIRTLGFLAHLPAAIARDAWAATLTLVAELAARVDAHFADACNDKDQP